VRDIGPIWSVRSCPIPPELQDAIANLYSDVYSDSYGSAEQGSPQLTHVQSVQRVSEWFVRETGRR
jgi:hypothetical protein